MGRSPYLISAFLMGSVFALLVIGMGAFNYAGYCSRTRARLSDQEKIDRVVDHVVRDTKARRSDDGPWTRLIYADRLDTNGKIKEISEKRITTMGEVGYEDKEEFLELNPNCCTITEFGKKGPDYYTVPLWDRLSGATSAMVRVDYVMRYVDPAGRAKSVAQTQYFAISNCGRVWNGI